MIFYISPVILIQPENFPGVCDILDNGSNKKSHILIISDNPQVLAEVKQELRGYFSVGIASSYEASLSALEVSDTSAIVFCICNESNDVFSIFEGLNDYIKSNYIPVIILAENGNDTDENKAFEMGASDYSKRRSGTSDSLIKRLQLRIHIGDIEKQLNNDNYPGFSNKPHQESILDGKIFLIAEDVELNRDIMKANLTGIQGFSIEFAINGQEAYDMFIKAPERYSMILMDVNMPVMDGLEATRHIRNSKNEYSKHIPIIALTAGIKEDDVTLCLKAGMDGFLEKPFEFVNLLEVVFEHCAQG